VTKLNPYVVLALSLAIAIAPWGQSMASWGAFTDISNVFALIGIVAGVIMAWKKVPPVKPSK